MSMFRFSVCVDGAERSSHRNSAAAKAAAVAAIRDLLGDGRAGVVQIERRPIGINSSDPKRVVVPSHVAADSLPSALKELAASLAISPGRTVVIEVLPPHVRAGKWNGQRKQEAKDAEQ